ncbi:MAG TPA: ABC transporter permease [Puia sp.]|nr:ABC transporter permease [Puia sp.]
MPANYLRITTRRLLRQKTFSLINVLGLSIGLAACLLIYLYVYSEMTYDAYNSNYSRIARVTSILHSPESDLALATAPEALGDALVRDYPEVETVCRIFDTTVTIRQGTDVFNADNFYCADGEVFKVWDFHFLEGSATGALSAPNSVVLARSVEKKYFGSRPALGRTMVLNGVSCRVTAVVEDRPANTDLRIDGLLSKRYTHTEWDFDDFDCYTYVLFRRTAAGTGAAGITRFNRKLAALDKYTRPLLDEQGAKGWALRFQAEPLADVHFSKGKEVDTPKGNRSFNRIFSALAVFILLIALLNYINLATARAADRMKEVGVRKVIGARPAQLVAQFLGESALLVAVAWLIAIGLVELGMPLFNRALETHLSFSAWGSILFPVLLFPVTILLAGAYPAFVLSRFRPVAVLKGGSTGASGAAMRKVFTAVQFGIALAMLAGAGVFYRQMYYMMHADPGIDRSQIVMMGVPQDSVRRAAVPAFAETLRRESEIRGVTVGTGLPYDGFSMASTTFTSGGGRHREVLLAYFFIDPQFLPLLHIRLVAGRNFSDSFPTDRKEAFIVNEAFVRTAGWKDPIGQQMEGNGNKGKVIGVVRNFFYKSMHNLIQPMAMIYRPAPPFAVLAKAPASALPRIRALWKQFFPLTPFDYEFMDQDFNAQYRKDRVTMMLFNGFTALAIFISCLGLYGLVSLIALRRAREIAIRKVLGAPLRRLMWLLSSGQLWLIGIAGAIALPLAAAGARRWLESYAYHTGLSVWIFALPVAALLLLTLAVTGLRIWRSARANPVESLRSE